MAQREPCEKCGLRASCREAFRQMGNIQGPSVVRNVLLAFVLPLVIFIAVLAIALQLLANRVESIGLRSFWALLLAFVAAAGCVMVVRAIGKWFGKK